MAKNDIVTLWNCSFVIADVHVHVVTIESFPANPVSQRLVRKARKSYGLFFVGIAHLLTIAAPHAAFWIAVVPTVSLAWAYTSIQVNSRLLLIKWLLNVDTS